MNYITFYNCIRQKIMPCFVSPILAFKFWVSFGYFLFQKTAACTSNVYMWGWTKNIWSQIEKTQFLPCFPSNKVIPITHTDEATNHKACVRAGNPFSCCSAIWFHIGMSPAEVVTSLWRGKVKCLICNWNVRGRNGGERRAKPLPGAGGLTAASRCLMKGFVKFE